MKVVTCSLMGGLGNQMFQTATTVALALDEGCECAIPPLPDQGCTRKTGYTGNILSRVKILKRKLPVQVYNEPHFTYTPLPRGFPFNLKLHGYFQSFKYFDKHYSQIKALFAPTPEIEKALEKYNFENSLAIHVRRGDYLQPPFNTCHPTQPIEYYQKAIELLRGTFERVYIFSDDIPWCRSQQLFSDLNPAFVEGEPDYISLHMIASCSTHIIANSSFSWWGAYLSNSRRVVYPTVWFTAKGPKYDMEDLMPSTLDGEGKRIWINISQ